MKANRILTVAALSTGLCLSAPHGARAGGPAPNTTGASVRGVVRFQGKASAPKAINMAADPSCSKLHPTPVMWQDIMVDGQGGLQNVVVFVSDGLGDRTFDPPTEPAVVDQKGCVYQPHVLAVRANQKLDLVNEDATAHNIHPQPTNNREWNKAEPPGAKMEDSFAREEVAIPVKCNIHPWMKGYIAVFKHPYFAVTGKDGTFDLTNLPPGTYTLKAWHEKLGTSVQTVTIGPNETKDISFVFKSM